MAALSFFPPPYPDELLYSICARYHLLSASPSQKQTLIDLFGTPTACAVHDLPTRLAHLSAQLPQGTVNTPERLMRHHTMFPLFEPFLPKQRATSIALKMFGSLNGGAIHAAIGVMASSVPALQKLRFCPECAAMDTTTYGEQYWHRSHQVPGVTVCHRHHGILTESLVAVSSQQNKHYFVTALHGMIKETHLETIPVHHEQLKTLAGMTNSLLNGCYPVLGLSNLLGRYRRALQQLGLATPSGQIIQREFLASFLSHFGADYLASIGCALQIEQQDNWLCTLVRHPRKASHPLRHLLLMHFLEMNPDLFFARQTVPYHPFGRSPWPCLNPAADHYLQSVISNCLVRRSHETGAPIGTFACECGFTYSRTGPDASRDDRIRISRKVIFGQLWENMLVQLHNVEGKSLRSTAKSLGVDTNTVIKHLAKRNVNAMNIVQVTSTEADILRAQREAWLALANSQPSASRTELRKLNPALYIWLYRYDHSWLLSAAPLPQQRTHHASQRVDWLSRDQEIAELARLAVEEFSRTTRLQRKISINMIGKRIGKLALLQQHLDKLPLTRAVLDSLIALDQWEML